MTTKAYGILPVILALCPSSSRAQLTAEITCGSRAGLHHGSWEIRAAAAQMLGKIGHRASDAVPALMAALSDKTDDVVCAAKTASREIDPARFSKNGR